MIDLAIYFAVLFVISGFNIVFYLMNKPYMIGIMLGAMVLFVGQNFQEPALSVMLLLLNALVLLASVLEAK